MGSNERPGLMDRTTFLDRVRTALAEAPPVDLPPAFPRTPASGTGADFETFRAALAAANGVARLVRRAELAGAVADVARELDAGSRTAVIAADVEHWREEVDNGLELAGVEAVRPEPPSWRQEAERAALGITSAELAVASTGSILVVPGPGHPRVASLLPAAHLAIVPVERLVAGFEDVIAALGDAASRSSGPVLITGPSRTSDIEMTMVFGVHGPKAVRVLVLTGG
jgi:L-lactate dehydrogenase complex protein LldG